MIRRLCFCGKVAQEGRNKCAQHQREKNRKRKRTPLQKATMGGGKRGKEYRRRRKDFIVGKLCEWQDCGKPATQIHHKVRTEPSHPLWLDRSNWMPVCHNCHAELEAKLMTRDHMGRWTGKQDP
jgi:5-methylcytosine-specific restriction endonuclease McrA